MATRCVFMPFAARILASSAVLSVVNDHPVIAFDASTDEFVYFQGVAPQGLTGTLTLVLNCMMASATSGAVGMGAALEAVTPGDALDLDTASSFATANFSASTTVPGTAGHMFAISITLTNADSIAAADLFTLSIFRDADSSTVSDTAAGDLYLLSAELRDAA